MFPKTPVDNDEDLYRSVPSDGSLYQTGTDGQVRFSSMVFADRQQKPSVDRAKLCNHDPTRARKQPKAGVTKVVAGDVRALGPLPEYDQKKSVIGSVQVDVEHMPEPDNPAHSWIYTDPACARGTFRRLLEALALLATQQGWLVEPQGSSPGSGSSQP